MDKPLWTRPEIEILVRIVLDGRKQGRADADSFILAGSELGRTHEACRWQWLCWQRSNPEGGIPESRYPKYNDPLTLEGDALILGDLEAPFHDAQFVNRCLAVAKAWNVRNLVLGGDAVHFESLSSFAPEFDGRPKEVMPEAVEQRLLDFAGKLPAKRRDELAGILAKSHGDADGGVSGELAEVRDVFRSIERQFDRVDFVIGNHEARLTRSLERALSQEDLFSLLRVGDKWRIAPYYFSWVISGGVQWKITHPRPTGKGSGKKLAAKFSCNIIMLHNHHFSVQSDISGRYLGIEPGCCVDESRLLYAAGRDTGQDAHVIGAVMLVNGKPHLLNDMMTDWERMMTARPPVI